MRRGEGEVCFYGPGIAVLWGESGGFVVSIEPCLGVPEEIVGCDFDGGGFGCPGGN